MIDHLIAERYANGLSAAVTDDSTLEPILEGLQDLAEVYAENTELRSVLANPSITLASRKQVLNDVLDAAQLPVLAKGLVRTLFERGRIGSLTAVSVLFSQIVDERLNRTTAEIITASPLTGDQEERIVAAMTKRSGKTVRLSHTRDPDILGGVVVKLQGTVIDGSLRTRLARVKEALLAKET